MTRSKNPPQGRLIISALYSHIDAVADALNKLERQFGRIQCETIDIPYTNTEKYSEEMGDNLMRRFFSFDKPVSRDILPDIKPVLTKIENQLGDRVQDFTFRTINLDPGIMSAENVVMASNHEYNHRIYIGKGVFADIQLIWARGTFRQLPWTHPDFCHEEAVDFFMRVRESFEFASGELTKSQSA
jgi:hypothetical protein